MALNISAGAIRNPIPPIVLILGLLFAGLTAYFRLPVNQLPNIEFGAFQVTVAQPGASPSDMETTIAQRVEAALSVVEGVKRVNTTINPGVATTFVELESNADVGRAVDDARDALQRVRQDLPADITEPVITRQEAAAEPVAYFAVERAGATPQDISWFIDNDLQRELLAIRGVSQVQRLGGVEREVRVEVDPSRLSAYGVSADQISAQLRQLNADLPGGHHFIAVLVKVRVQRIDVVTGRVAPVDVVVVDPAGRTAQTRHQRAARRIFAHRLLGVLHTVAGAGQALPPGLP